MKSLDKIVFMSNIEGESLNLVLMFKNNSITIRKSTLLAGLILSLLLICFALILNQKSFEYNVLRFSILIGMFFILFLGWVRVINLAVDHKIGEFIFILIFIILLIAMLSIAFMCFSQFLELKKLSLMAVLFFIKSIKYGL